MSAQQTAASHGGSDGLWRWLVGGLVAGGVVLGLLIAAYAVGYHRGRHHSTSAAVAQANSATTPATTTVSAAGPVQATPALVTRGKTLFTADGCSACHSLTGAAGAGPSLKGVAGGNVSLADGTTVAADDGYLERSLTSPDAQIVKGYHAGIMSAAVSSYAFGSKPDDVRALVAFLKTQK